MANHIYSVKKNCKSKAVVGSVSGENVYQCADQFIEGDDIKVFRGGKLVPSSHYRLYKQGKVEFLDDEKSMNRKVKFKYRRETFKYPSFSLDCNSYKSELLEKTEGSMYPMDSIVDDPLGTSSKVFKISCSRILDNAKKIRLQYAIDKYNLTHFRDRIKLYIPEDMYDALISYPGVISWFSIQGSWGQFGSGVGATENMYSGSANSLDIVKLAPNDTLLYLNLRCRRRHCNTETGLEEYDVLTEEHSSFPLKKGEWITLEREWQVGNPGICNHTVIDTEGRHEFNVVAYNSVCDPENEVIRYGEKYAGSNPYNYFNPFICKIYTSRQVAQHCIDKIGQCYLYFKDYEFLEGESVNVL